MDSEFWTSQTLVHALYANLLEPVCRTHHLTRMELDVLLFLANNPALDTATDIVEKRRLTKSHVSLAVNALVHKGYLSRTFQENNRKTMHLVLCASALNRATGVVLVVLGAAIMIVGR